ncbi:MAG TPA: aromatic hydrocarbon degradation protein, partial [Puia sp.]|nr:aromatic hydrocarbon degradation protein [Puia sp.]
AEEFAGSNLSIDDALGTTSLSYGARMALYTYLIDTATINGNVKVIAQPEKAGLLGQDNTLRTKGGITEIGLSLATNVSDKWYFGGTLGIPILSYTRYQTYREADLSGNTNNDFESFTYQETYTSKGVGLNLKLGMIFKPTASWRLGLAIHTPSVYGVTDKINASLVARTENYTSSPQASISSDSLDLLSGIAGNSINYNLYTPWKFLVSGSYVFGGESKDIRQQKGFITADVEYTTITSTHFQRADQNTDANYYDAVNSAIKGYYKGSLGARLGGELKFNTFMARAGVAYYTNPYNDSQLKADRLFLSGGIGYRDSGFFIDLTYVQGFSRDVNFPYRLSDKANTFSTLKEMGGTVVATFGIKF